MHYNVTRPLSPRRFPFGRKEVGTQPVTPTVISFVPKAISLSQTRLGTFRSLESECFLIRARSSTCARAVERADVRYGPFERSAPEDVPSCEAGSLRQWDSSQAPQTHYAQIILARPAVTRPS